MIEFPLYKVTCERYEVLTEDPDMLREYVVKFLEDNEEVVITRVR